MLAEHALNSALEKFVTPPLMKHIESLLQPGADLESVRHIVAQHGDAADFQYRWQKEAVASAIMAHATLVTNLDKDISWKTLIQIQQRQSEIARIAEELDRSRRRDVRRWWFTMIEVLVHVKKGTHMRPLTLNTIARLRIAWQTMFSKSVFK